MRLFTLLLLLTGLATPAAAQRFSGPSTSNERLVERAVESLGVDYRRAGVGRHVERAFDELFPEHRWATYRLSAAQARALALLALEAAGYTVDLQRPARPGPPRPYPQRPDSGCRDASGRIYDLALAIPPDRFRLFLDEEERALARAALTEIGRDATACGCRALADAALATLRAVNTTIHPERAEIVEDIDRMREVADDCR
jgi:hypothetical protein